jgi:hypothetical protein
MKNKQTPIEQYLNRRTPFQVTDQMRHDALRKEAEDALRDSSNDEVVDPEKIPTEQKIAAIREKILRQDHSAYDADGQ